MRRGRLAIPLVCVVLAGCASGGATTTGAHGRPGTRTMAVGRPLAPRPVEVMGIRGSLELSVADPSVPSAPSLYLTLGRSVRREPRDVCFGSYAGNESPKDGDASCQVRGGQPLILTLSEHAIPCSSPVLRFAAVWGHVGLDVARVVLIGPGGVRVVLPLSAHRMFLVAFAPSARGRYQLVIRRTNGASFVHGFTLPLTPREAGAWPRLTRRGAVFSDAPIGENIVTRTYREIIKRLGPPLRTFTRRGGVRCIYYDIVGYETGWRFCFRGQSMVAAAGNQPPPRR